MPLYFAHSHVQVALYLSKLLSDVALSDRLAEDMKEVGMAEARVAISYASSSGLDGGWLCAYGLGRAIAASMYAQDALSRHHT